MLFPIKKNQIQVKFEQEVEDISKQSFIVVHINSKVLGGDHRIFYSGEKVLGGGIA